MRQTQSWTLIYTERTRTLSDVNESVQPFERVRIMKVS
jgi:hypothetical protein